MSISFQLSDEQTARLEHLARALNVAPRTLVQAAVDDLLARNAADFERAADQVLEKNRELYRRLA